MFFIKKELVFKIIGSVICGHLFGFVTLFFSALIGVNLDSTEKLPIYVGFAAIGVGAVACGLTARKMGIGIAGALVSGLFYSAILSAGSFVFGGESELSVGMRLSVFFGAALIAGAISLLPVSGAKKGYSMKKKRSAVNKYIEAR